MGTTSDVDVLPTDAPPADLRPFGGADAYLRDCASRAALDVIANKWVCLVVGALRAGPARFGELRRRLDGITQKMLTQTLRELESATGSSTGRSTPARHRESTTA